MTIPKDARRSLNITHPGRVVLDFEEKNKSFKIRPIVDILDLAGTFKPRRHRGVSVLKAREYMEKHYERF